MPGWLFHLRISAGLQRWIRYPLSDIQRLSKDLPFSEWFQHSQLACLPTSSLSGRPFSLYGYMFHSKTSFGYGSLKYTIKPGYGPWSYAASDAGKEIFRSISGITGTVWFGDYIAPYYRIAEGSIRTMGAGHNIWNFSVTQQFVSVAHRSIAQ